MQTRSQTRHQTQTQTLPASAPSHQEGGSRRDTYPRKVKRTSYLDMFDSDDDEAGDTASASSPASSDSADSDYENDDYLLPMFNFDEARRAWHADLRKRSAVRDLTHEFNEDLESVTKRTRSPPARYRDNQ